MAHMSDPYIFLFIYFQLVKYITLSFKERKQNLLACIFIRTSE